jgi:hypothetical protein
MLCHAIPLFARPHACHAMPVPLPCHARPRCVNANHAATPCHYHGNAVPAYVGHASAGPIQAVPTLPRVAMPVGQACAIPFHAYAQPMPASARPCQCSCDAYVGYTSANAMPMLCHRQACAGHANAMPGHAHVGHARPCLCRPCQCHAYVDNALPLPALAMLV